MGGEWTIIGEIAEVFDGPHATPEKIDEGPYFLSISSLENGKLDLSKSARLSEQQFLNWTKRVTPREGDVLFSYETRLGEAALMPGGIRACLGRRMGLLRPDTEKVDPRYLLFAYLGPDFQREIKARTNSGATVDRIALKELPDFPIRIPQLQEQKFIAHILGTLDDKIELNRQMNATLEAMAQALFKSWFLDFDPVIDNALATGNPIPEELQTRADARATLGDKRKPLPEAIQKQFPSSFVFTEEKGWMPEGWAVRPIGESFQLLNGHPFKSQEYVEDGEYGVVTIKNVQDGIFVQECSSSINKLPLTMKEHCRLSPGDVLLSLTGNVGRVCIVCDGKYLLNQRVAKIVGVEGVPTSFAYFFFRQSAIYEAMLTIAKGTAQQNLSPIETLRLKQVMPSPKDYKVFAAAFDEIFQKIVHNIDQYRSLSGVRDTLLPKLLSGELRIPNAEKIVAEAI